MPHINVSDILEDKVILYSDANGEIKLDVSLENHTVWLSQKQMSVLFDKNVKTINEHIGNIFKEGELEEDSTVRNFRIVQMEGSREVEREIASYSLDVIISVGYRVKSKRGTQFRIWANKILKDYLVQGYVVNQRCLFKKGLRELTATMELVRSSIEAKEIGSDASQKELMIKLIINLLSEELR